jgi:hypothetical protein
VEELCNFPKKIKNGEVHESTRMVGVGECHHDRFEELKNFATIKDDRTFEAKTMMHHLRMFNGFVLCTTG